jgi:PAS domain S-box-containing protein
MTMEDKEDRLREGWLLVGGMEEQYHKMVEEVEDYAILLLDTNGIIRNWNKGAQKIKGYEEEEILGKHFRIFYTTEDQIAGLPDKLVETAILEGKAVHEGWRVRKDGTRFWGSIVITALHDKEGRVVGFSKVTRDLTERKLAEDQLVRYSLKLESQNKELQQFAYAAAHDMKEPLRKVQFYYSAIMEEGVESLSEKQRVHLDRSLNAVVRMQRLIEDLLLFTKTAELVQHFEWVDLNDVIGEVAASFQDALQEANGTIVSSALPTIKAIPYQVRQIFVNLFGNAIKYRDPKRPLRIEVTGKSVQNLDEGLTQDVPSSPFLQMTVRDNGIGFAAEYADRIFDMFERLHGREKYEGTGIGLSICRKVMENHKGFIRAAGSPGEGAAFELFFPV